MRLHSTEQSRATLPLTVAVLGPVQPRLWLDLLSVNTLLAHIQFAAKFMSVNKLKLIEFCASELWMKKVAF